MTGTTNDHDLLIQAIEQIKFVRQDIKELKEGTAKKISDLETEVIELKKWKDTHIQENKDTARYNTNYMKILIALGGILAIALIYHITGYKI